MQINEGLKLFLLGVLVTASVVLVFQKSDVNAMMGDSVNNIRMFGAGANGQYVVDVAAKKIALYTEKSGSMTLRGVRDFQWDTGV